MKTLRLALSLAAVALVGGCASAPSGSITLPVVPKWQASPDARTFTGTEIVAGIAELAPGAFIELSDATFTPVSHAWLEQAATWSWHFMKARRRGGFVSESFDCDKFALGFAFAANIAAGDAGVKAQPLVARIHVFQNQAFGGVGAGGGHALNAFLSERGIFVFEPQTRTLVPLAQYPNRTSIFRVKIGG